MSSKKAKGKSVGPVVFEDPAMEKAAETRREEAFQAEPEWNGQPLEWSVSKESLFYALRHAVGAREISEVLGDIDAFFADAIRIIYLCLHGPDDWRNLRSTPMLWQEAIEKWADETILPKERTPAVLTAWKVLQFTWENTHQPVKAAGKAAVGK